MAEQNILNGDQQVLEQILGDINEHAEKKERLERMSVSIRDITKEIDSTTKAMEDEISSRISESTDSICAGYDKAVSQDKDTIKQVQADRDKAKMQGIKERIASETASLRAENKSLQNEINEAFIQENIPRIVNNSFFMALYISRKVRDVLVYTLFLLIVFALIPAVLYLLPVIPAYVPVIYAGVMGILLLIIGRSVYINLILAHKDTIMAARDTRYKIRDNKRIIKKTQHSIKKDKDEAMYGLESFDNRINSIGDNIKKTEEEKQNALREFEETVKPDLVKEVEGRYLDKLNLMREELAKKKDEYMKLDDLIKQQRIYISSNYEAYLGKEFVNVQRLTELDNIISSGEAQTISQAMAVYKNRK